MLAFKSYVLSEAALEDECDAASAGSALLHLVERKLQSEADSIGPIMSDLMPAVEFVAMNQERRSADPEIFGDFPAQLGRIRELWARLSFEDIAAHKAKGRNSCASARYD